MAVEVTLESIKIPMIIVVAMGPWHVGNSLIGVNLINGGR